MSDLSTELNPSIPHDINPTLYISTLSCLSITTIAIATRERPDYYPVTALAEHDELRRLASGVAEHLGAALDSLALLSPPTDDTPDLSALALAALGPEHREEPLFLVRSGPLPDPQSAFLARLVHESEWIGEDIGVTHLDELGGTLVFDLLAWAVHEQCGAIALICDEPLFTPAADAPPPGATTAVRVLRHPGPLRVLGCAEGPPPSELCDATHRFSGSRPCDGWLALHDAASKGQIEDGEQVLIHTRGPLREGWLLLEASDIAALHLVIAEADSGRWRV
jgi:hypothetical protein